MTDPLLSTGWHELAVGDGRAVDLFVVRGAEPGPTTVVTGGIHGDEYEGPAAARDLAGELVPAAVRGTVALVPVANPTAFAAGTRLNPEDGQNLARSFPGDPAGSPTERLAAALFAVAGRADVLVDLHSGGVEYLFAPVAGFYGPAADSNPSFAAARRFGLPRLWQLPDTPGVLSFELHRRGATAVGCEYLGGGRLSPAGRAAYRRGVLNLLTDAPAADPPAFVGDWLLTEADGLFECGCAAGEGVAAGQELAVLTDPRGRVVQRFAAPHAGDVLAVRHKAGVRAGAWGVLVGRPAEGTG